MALVGAALLSGGAYAVPATRAALDDVASFFGDWAAGNDEEAPGREVKAADAAPSWVTEGGESRLIAEANGVGLYVKRIDTEHDTQLLFALGDGSIAGGSVQDWSERFDRHAIVVLGRTTFDDGAIADEEGRFPLLGVTSRSVGRVELRYAAGPPLVAEHIDGGFVMMADIQRRLHEIIAYDHVGNELERISVRHIDMRRYCPGSPGCPGAESAP
jgi:hypothetical protein